jgi:uncharacterized protein YpmB
MKKKKNIWKIITIIELILIILLLALNMYIDNKQDKELVTLKEDMTISQSNLDNIQNLALKNDWNGFNLVNMETGEEISFTRIRE